MNSLLLVGARIHPTHLFEVYERTSRCRVCKQERTSKFCPDDGSEIQILEKTRPTQAFIDYCRKSKGKNNPHLFLDEWKTKRGSGRIVIWQDPQRPDMILGYCVGYIDVAWQERYEAIHFDSIVTSRQRAEELLTKLNISANILIYNVIEP